MGWFAEIMVLTRRRHQSKHRCKPTNARCCISYDIMDGKCSMDGWKYSMDGWNHGHGEKAMATNPSLAPKHMRMNECGEISNSFSSTSDSTRSTSSTNFLELQDFRSSFHARSLPFGGGGWGPFFVGCCRNGEGRMRSELRSSCLR